MNLTRSLFAKEVYLSSGWNLPNFGDLDPSVMMRRKAHTDPPTQYWIVASERRKAYVDLAVLECHSNME